MLAAALGLQQKARAACSVGTEGNVCSAGIVAEGNAGIAAEGNACESVGIVAGRQCLPC